MTIDEKIEELANKLCNEHTTNAEFNAEFIASQVLSRVCGLDPDVTLWKDINTKKISSTLYYRKISKLPLDDQQQ